MPYKDPADKRRWQQRNSAKQGEWYRDWARRNPDKVRAGRLRALEQDKARPRILRRRRIGPAEAQRRANAGHKRNRQVRRVAAIAKLGGACCRCGFDNPAALEFDHKVAIRRRTTGRRRRDSKHAALEILRLAEPQTVYQLLCANCHTIKTRENGEFGRDPHEELCMRWFGLSSSVMSALHDEAMEELRQDGGFKSDLSPFWIGNSTEADRHAAFAACMREITSRVIPKYEAARHPAGRAQLKLFN